MSATPASATAQRTILQSLERWKGTLDEAKLPMFRSFVADTLGRLRGPFLAQHTPLEVLEILETAFRFAFERKGNELRVEVRKGIKKGAMVLTSMPDQAFIVDTIRLFLKRHDADYWGGFNLVYQARRDENGLLVGGDNGESESLVLLEADLGTLLDDPKAASAILADNLAHARAMTTDFKPMTRTIERFVEKFEVEADRHPARADAYNETAAFLKWLLRENFVFMGVDAGEPLGFCRMEGIYRGGADGEWPNAHTPGTVRVRKASVESPVHRAGRIDEIVVTLPDQEGQSLYIRGLFTYRAVTQPSRHVPILRGVLGAILETQQSKPGSFRYKGIANVFDSLPTEFLFTASQKEIADIVDLVFEAEQQQEVGVTFLMTGKDSAFCLTAMPKAEYGEDLRRDLERLLITTLKASYADHGLFFGRYDTVLLHHYLTGVKRPTDAEVAAMTDRIREIATPWQAKLWQALAGKYDDATADRMAETYGRAFPENWIRGTSVARALADIDNLEKLSGERNLVADVYMHGNDLVLALYQAADIYLTDILPVLDNFGLVVVDSATVEVTARGGSMVMDIFNIAQDKGLGKDLILSCREKLIEAIEAVFAGSADKDRLNQLVPTAGLDWAEVDMLRGLMRYCRQLNVKILTLRMQEILLTHPHLAQHLVALFHTRHNPDLVGDRAKLSEAAEEVVRGDLRKVRGYDEDQMFQALLQLILAMVRTNYYRTDRTHHYLSFKFDAAKVALMGPRRPMYEIYVHHESVEGVHLRFGKVARGGIRWSDRDDFRQEVLGLVTTQHVKNVVIVPEGAKGGFLLKHPSRDLGIRRQDADRLYETFIRGLLDLTDNGVGGKITKPPRVYCHDGDDPYLVVAADKGTAHLSNTANALSMQYGHWLGDAFASGGSNGYDHKKVGITARGAWVLVKRHFAELGLDPYTQEFTCSGVGDMSGDVFGNGLIESKKTKLVAAFNHIHIFLDPTPHAASSYEERLRLFKAERKGGWENYDLSKISAGGGVFDRNVKSIPLSPQVQTLLGLNVPEAAPDTVVQAILKLDVDLMWNGGIGTYVKASTETDADADDRSNDAVRVDGNMLRCKILGEGGNLGCTQRGRVEAGLAGVRLNTDAIDNSGGVDMSDHEVNLKILLDRVVTRGQMGLTERNELLSRMTDEVAQLVMASNDAHGRQLSRDQVRSKHNIFAFGRAIAFVEQMMGQSRDSLKLPTDSELSRRAQLGLGLTRPELAVLQAWVKMFVYRELVRGEPKSVPGYMDLLVTYFPKELQTKYREDIENHMLADEIAMTMATTRLLADAGAAFVPMMVETTGASVGQIAAAYLRAQSLARLPQVRDELEVLSPGEAQACRYTAWVALDRGVQDVAADWLTSRNTLPTDVEIAALAGAPEQVWKQLPAETAARLAEEHVAYVKAGLSEGAAKHVELAQYLGFSVAAHAEARQLGISVSDMVIRHLAVARASRLQDVLDNLKRRPATGRWDPVALQILHDRFQTLLRTLVAATPAPKALPTVDELAITLAAGPLAPVRAQIDAIIGNDVTPSIPALIVLEDRVSGRIARVGQA